MARTLRDRQEFAPYLRALGDILRLRDWDIEVSPHEPDGATAMADVHCTFGMKHASIRLSDQYLGDTEDEQRYYAAHEVTHLHDAMEKHFLHGVLTPEQFKTYTLLHEHMIDGIAKAFSPFLPLPSEVLGGIDTPEPKG